MFPALSYSFLLVVFVKPLFANILLHWTQPFCNPERPYWTGCLRGQVCLSDRTCQSPNLHNKRQNLIVARNFSTDGRCGPDNGDLLCDPGSKTYFGTCCSRYGWCGNTDAYCGQGCVANCSRIDISAISKLFSTSQTASTTQSGEPILVLPSSTTAGSVASSTSNLVTTDGTCGLQFDGTICGDWYKGSCCSMYGWCGNTTAHCGDGCQSGPCLEGDSQALPVSSSVPVNANPGSFAIIGQSGVPAMHAALVENGRVVFLDKVENYTQLHLANGRYAYSAEYDLTTNQAAPLAYQSNAFCSGGIFLADGRLLDIGGNAPLPSVDPTVGDGFTALRYLTRSSVDPEFNSQNWVEPGNKLSSARWYASAQILPNGTVFVASGSLNGLNPTISINNNPTYEILSAQGVTSGQSILMDILEVNQPYYMYPFLHLLSDGAMFVFVSKSAELFDITTGTTSRKFDDLPGDYRTYPNTGGSVLLPLSSSNDWEPEIIICGGGAYQDISSPTDASCGRIRPLSADATWEMDSMPEGRTMVEGTLVPDGTVIWLNGCNQGAQGFGLGAHPAYEVLIYDPMQPLGQRFTTGATSSIARMYHSVALLLLDGTIMIAGSNPVEQPILTPNAANPYVTEFRVEVYTPPYLSGDKVNQRPTEITLSTTALTSDSSTFTISFTVSIDSANCSVILYYGGFITHSLHMGQRMIILDTVGFVGRAVEQTLIVTMPPNSNIAPPGPYVVYVLVNGVPGIGQFVSVS